MSDKERVESIASFLLPFIVTAGDYACEIQKRIVNQPSKNQFEDPGAQALTDADLSVQNFIEVALLARFPELCFYGEEYAQSLNQKYFLRDSDLEIWLDPIDGTLRYQNGADQFSTIVSFLKEGHLIACLWYLPKLNVFSYGSEWGGIRQGSREDAIRGYLGESYSLTNDSEVDKKIISYKLDGQLSQNLRDFSLTDISDVSKAIYATSFSEFSGLVARSAGVIDLLVAGMFYKWGGGRCTNFAGDDFPALDARETPSYGGGVIAAASVELYEKIFNAVQRG